MLVSLVAGHLLLVAGEAAQWPSLFRGIVVADGEVGVRIVSIDEASQAYQADLRPQDLIVRIGETEVRSIDQFGRLSERLKGRAHTMAVLVLRNGKPVERRLHLYSYPILREWGIEHIPEHDVRFAVPQVGVDYWRRLGRGFDSAGKPTEALDAYLNALHNVPTDLETALKASALFAQLGRRHVEANRLREGLAALRQSITLLQRLLAQPLTEEQMRTVRDQLRKTVDTLHAANARATSR